MPTAPRNTVTDKTEAQPEALRLAACLDCDATDADMGRKPIACTRRKAAAELRRQHAEIQQLKAQLSARQAAPEGWRPVPVEPTEEMLMAYSANPCNAAQAVAVYRAMLSAAPPPPEREPRCWCETCRPNTLSDMRMVLCPDCGNKRCPKPTHHDNACTNSNAPGQPGSSWEHVKPHGATNDNP